MPPMTRTSRKDPSLNALDDLDLDDMFEGGNDGLFDDLGMDLDEIGDITAVGGKQNGDAPPVPKGVDDMNFNLLGDIGIDDGATSSPSKPNDEPPLKKSRRKTKRKSKVPYDEDDYVEDEPAKKKRRTKKTKATTKKTSKANAAKELPEISIPPPVTKGTKTKKKASSLERASSQGMVAQAGQFGRQNKRGSFQPIARSTSKSAHTNKNALIPIEALPPPPKRNRSIAETVKPLETLYCGLKPSPYFFPFLPTLPPEVSMKKCNKLFPRIDKINSALASAEPGLDIEDHLLKLLMLHDALPTKEKKLIMSASIVNARSSMTEIDRQKLVEDLTSTAMLIKRQHDFLAQSLDNMERWSKGNFSADDYRDVYGGDKPKPVVLSQLSSPNVRVRIKLAGYKEPKTSSILMAYVVLPGSKHAPPISPTKEPPVKKKPPSRSGGGGGAERPSASPPDTITEVVRPPLQYPEMLPSGRLQYVRDLVTKNAIALDLKQGEAYESRRKGLDKVKQGLDKMVEDGGLLITTSMWKWVERSGIFADYKPDDIKELAKLQQPEISEGDLVFSDLKGGTRSGSPIQDPLCDRLMSLLVDVNDDDDDDDDGDEGLSEDEEGSADDSICVNEPINGMADKIVDLSNLSMEERAYIHLRVAGLMDESCKPPDSLNEDEQEGEAKELNGSGGARNDGEFGFEDLMTAMKADLLRMDRVNNSRVTFLQSSSRSHLDLQIKSKRQEERRGQMITKCNQLMKKQKENKRSVRQQKGNKTDEDWMPLPW